MLVKKPLISFVIPVLNGEDYIARCLLSIRNFRVSCVPYEILVMDNGSTDRTLQIIHELGFDCQVVRGVSVGGLRNRGAAMSRGDYIAFVDSDVELGAGWLQHGLSSFGDRNVLAVGGPRLVSQNATWVQKTWNLHLSSRRCDFEPTPVSWLYSMAFMVNRNAFLGVGGFNEDLRSGEDVDLCYRLGKEGTILYDPKMVATHWGEDRDLQTFWRKEIWRGLGNLKGVLSHGLRWDELPSLGYPVYMLGLFFFLAITGIQDLWHRQFFLTPLNLGFLALPALVLAFDTSCRAGQVRALPQLFLLYLVYGCARACSLIKGCTQGHV